MCAIPLSFSQLLLTKDLIQISVFNTFDAVAVVTIRVRCDLIDFTDHCCLTPAIAVFAHIYMLVHFPRFHVFDVDIKMLRWVDCH